MSFARPWLPQLRGWTPWAAKQWGIEGGIGALEVSVSSKTLRKPWHQLRGYFGSSRGLQPCELAGAGAQIYLVISVNPVAGVARGTSHPAAAESRENHH